MQPSLATLVSSIPPLAEIRAEKARRSLAEFVRQSWRVLEPSTLLLWNWHMEAICLHVQAALEDWQRKQSDPTHEQRIKDLLINVPPGSAKSRIVSVCAPAWMWLRFPTWRVICLSGNPRVSTRDSLYCRTLIEDDWYQQTFRPTWRLAPDQDTKTLFKNTVGGFRQASTMTSKISGDRADALLIDDPNDAEEVNSEAHRTEVNERWDVAIANRVNDPRSSVRIGIMQRLHEDDWTGHVLQTGSWTHLVIPQEYDPGRNVALSPINWIDPRNEPGELLHPERFPRAVLDEERKRLGSYGYAGQHDQRPAPKGGGQFKRHWWRFWKPDGVQAEGNARRPDGCRDEPARALPGYLDEVIISVDARFGGKDAKNSNRSYVVIQTWAAKGADRYLLRQRRGRWDYTETKTQFLDECRATPHAGSKYIENKANGSAIIDDLQSVVPGLIPVEPEGGKESRAARMQPEVEAGNVFLPEGAAFLDEFVEEFALFPQGANDDQVDAASQGLLKLMDSASMVFRAQAG